MKEKREHIYSHGGLGADKEAVMFRRLAGKRPMGTRPCPSEASGRQNADIFERSGESV